MPSPADSGAECEALDRHGIAAALLPGSPARLPIWLVDARQPPDPSAIALLSGTERARAARFRDPSLRDRYVAAHAGLRLLAELRFGIPVARQHWVANEFGKPRLADLGFAHCSISYTGGRALLAWSDESEIGVDIERLRPIEDAAELMETYYTESERRTLREIEHRQAAFDRAFLAVWVRKEACVKALGRGLDIPLHMVHCGVGEQTEPVQVGDCLLHTGVLDCLDGHVVAWAQCRDPLTGRGLH